jgi:hypothetical protein
MTRFTLILSSTKQAGMKNELPEPIWQLTNQLFKQGYSIEEISSRLRHKGIKDTELQQALTELKKWRLAKRRNAGFIWCGIGSFLLVSGCMLTFVQISNGQNIRLIMYGLTTIGIIAILKGLIDLFGW